MPMQLICKLFALFLLCASVAAQSTEQATRNQQAARLSLQQLRASINEIENECGKIRAQMQLADWLWTHDEQQARQLFAEAFQQAFPSQPPTNQPSCAPPSRYALGVAVLTQVARRDPAWANELVEALPEPGATGRSGGTAEAQAKARLREILVAYQPTGKAVGGANGVATNQQGELIRAALLGATATEMPARGEPTGASEQAVLRLLAPSTMTAPPLMNPQFDAVQAIFSGDFQQARGLLEKISDPQTRQQFAQIIGHSQRTALLAAGQYEEALQGAQELATPLQRSLAQVQIVQAVRNKKGALRALEILLRAEQSLQSEQESLEKAHAFIALAGAMVELDLERGFELAQTAITTLNALSQEATQQNQESGLEPLLGRLATADFARAWSVASNLQHRDLAWFTKLAICQASLAQIEERKN